MTRVLFYGLIHLMNQQNGVIEMKAIFNYPDYGYPSAFPKLQKLAGQTVDVVRKILDTDVDENLYLIRSKDGEEAEVYESELTFIGESK